VTRCDDLRPLLGSYVLAGLDGGETVSVKEHLRTCDDCRREHARLSPLPALLDVAELRDVADVTPSPRLEGSVLAGYAALGGGTGRAPRRARRPWAGRPRWQVAAAGGLAGVAATIAVLAIAGAFSGGVAQTRVALMPPSGGGAARAEARLTSTSAGTAVRLDADLPPLRPGELYELWFGRPDGVVSAGTFRVGADGRADVRLTTAARAGRYERMGISREPDAADPARNGPAVVVGALPD
jgi:hypothetical protein